MLKMPDDLVFHRILPATGMMMCLSTAYYAWLAYRLALKTGRTDICALPSQGYQRAAHVRLRHLRHSCCTHRTIKTGDPIKRPGKRALPGYSSRASCSWSGGFIAPIIRKVTPRAARSLGTLARCVRDVHFPCTPGSSKCSPMTPVIAAFSPYASPLILASWFGGVRYFRGTPAGLVADRTVGTVIAWVSSAAGWGFGGMSGANLSAALSNFHVSIPMPAVNHVFSGFQFLGVILVTAIPFGIYDLVEAMDNVESAAVAGDSFPTTRVLTADGVVSLIGCMMGNPFINACVYHARPPRLEGDGRTD